MGVNGLCKTLTEYFAGKRVIEKLRFSKLRTDYGVNTIGIDVMPYLYLNMNHPVKFMKILSAMIRRITSNGITPLFIFDVRNHIDFVQSDEMMDSATITLHYKEGTLQKRNKQRNQYKIEFDMYETVLELKESRVSFRDFEEMIGKVFRSLHISDITIRQLYDMNVSDIHSRMEWCEKKSMRLKNEHIQFFCMLCLQYEVPYIFSSGEADPLLANLCKEGVIQAVISEDTDMIPFGTPLVLRDFHFYSDEITVFHTNLILNHLNLTPLQMIDWCILMGNDYNNRLKGYKPLDSLELIREHGNIEKIFDLLFIQLGKNVPESIAYQDIRGIYLQRLDNRYIRIVQNLLKTPSVYQRGHHDLLNHTESCLVDPI